MESFSLSPSSPASSVSSTDSSYSEGGDDHYDTSSSSSPPSSSSSFSEEDYDPPDESTRHIFSRPDKNYEIASKRFQTPFICRHSGCYYIGQRVSHLQAHDRVHSGQQPFSCRIGSCTKQATTKSGILHHIEVHHPTEASVCLSAGYGRLLPLAEHVDIDQVMLDREQLQIEQWLDSEECRVKARNVVNTQHFRIRSSANTRSSLSSSLDTTVQTSATTSETASAAAAAAGTFSCRHCGRIDFENFESLRRHDRLDHSHFTPFYCAISDCNFAGQLKEDVERHFSEFHSSEGLTFMSQYLYVDEPALDLEEEQIRQWLNTVDVQIASSASTENGQRPSAALQTSTIENDVVDNNNENLNSNAASTNTAYSPPISSCAESLGPLVICRTNPKDGPPIYICQRPNCKQKLSKYQHLVRHDRIHRKANPWRCGMCGYLSSRTCNIKAHLRSIHFNPIWGKKKSRKLDESFDDYLREYLEEDSELLRLEKDLFNEAEKRTLPSIADEDDEGAEEGEENESSEEDHMRNFNTENNQHQQQSADDLVEEKYEDDVDELLSPPSESSSASSASASSASSAASKEPDSVIICCETRNNRPYFICQRGMPPCGKEYTYITSLKRHDRGHRGVTPFSCREYTYSSTRKSNVKRHILMLHPQIISPQKCIAKDNKVLRAEKMLFARAERWTNRSFPFQSADEDNEEEEEELSGNEEVEENEGEESYEALLARYEQLLLQYPYECRIDPNCQLGFTKDADRLVHEREHIGVKPFQCTWPVKNYDGNINTEICGQHFLREQFTRDHIKAEHYIELEGDAKDDDLYIDQYIFVNQELLTA